MLEERIAETIARQGLFREGERILVAVSGGADSVALFHLLRRLAPRSGYLLTAVHLEHGIRGTESVRDAGFVRALCDGAGIPLVSEAARVPETAREHGVSLETAGRLEREDRFERIRQERECDSIALGHHRDDQAETVLHNMLRGAGLRGMGGMPWRRGRIVRPLLETGREELVSWLQTEGYSWREDHTNEDPAFTRNRIRREVLPACRTVNVRAAEHLAETAWILQAEDAYLQEQTGRFLAEHAQVFGTLAVRIGEDAWVAAPLALQRRVLRECYRRLSGRSLERRYVLEWTGRGTETLRLPGGFFLRSARGARVMGQRTRAGQAYRIPVPMPGSVVLPGGLRVETAWMPAGCREPFVREHSSGTTAFLEVPEGEVLYARSARPGDAYVPVGFFGERAVAKVFSESGLGPLASSLLPVFTDGPGRILWAATGRPARDVRVTGESRKILRIDLCV